MKKFLKKSYRAVRSDLACEFIKPKRVSSDEILSINVITLSENQAKTIGKSKGTYVTLDTLVVMENLAEEFYRVSDALAQEIKKMLVGKNILIVGLGNYKLGADSLGSRVCSYVNVTRKIIDCQYCISCITPGVIGATGIESFEVVKGVCDTINPDSVIVIDSLCASSITRLLTSFQITDAGITPGSGVANHRMTLSKESLGVNVISIGIPTVVYASTIVKEFSSAECEPNIVVSPKDIDFMIKDCALIIADALNETFGVNGF